MASGNSETSALGTVLVVGGCGFLGHHIVDRLTKYKCNIAVLDLSTTRNRHASSSITYHDGDITSRESLLPTFQKLKPAVVIHTASPTVVGANWNKKAADALYKKVNVDGTRMLLEVAKETGVKAFVYTSSASVVCSIDKPIYNADERWPLIMGKSQPEYYTHTKVCPSHPPAPNVTDFFYP
jgi:sterol-4alpha-carboxylate 3-dehydrogenase (decarboxylating)